MYNKFTYLIKTRFFLKKPEKKKILIFDRSGSDAFTNYLKKSDYSILDRRYESINISILIKSLFRHDLKCKFSEKYFLTFIESVKPKILLTFIENNPVFYSLKSKKINFKKIFVQNGLGFNEIIKKYNLDKKINKVDYMFTFSEDYSKIFSKYIKGRTIAIGGFKNNHVKIKKYSSNNDILFISQWRERDTPEYPYNILGKKLIIFLNNFCYEKKKSFVIIGAYNKDNKLEKKFYDDILKEQNKKCNYKFIPKKNIYANYKHVDNSKIIITVDSALGYESFARGSKVIFYNFRSKKNMLRYGWPGKYNNEGKFWLNSHNESKLKKMINYLLKINTKKWLQIKKITKHQKVFYDYKNTNFKKIINILKK